MGGWEEEEGAREEGEVRAAAEEVMAEVGVKEAEGEEKVEEEVREEVVVCREVVAMVLLHLPLDRMAYNTCHKYLLLSPFLE